MIDNRILLTTPCTPYPTLPANDSLTDATGQRFTKGDDVFTIVSHTHCYANHILAQNVERPVTLLEYPTWDDFTEQVDRGHQIIGMSAYPPHLDKVMEMCTYIRQRSPGTTVMLGSYGGQAFDAAYDAPTKKKYVDHIVHGEGVSWLRKYLGESTDRPIRQALMPKAGGAPEYITRFPRGAIGFLVSGLGCIGGCDFCSSTALFDTKRLQLLSPGELVEHIELYHRHFDAVSQVFVIEEDHFRYPKYLSAIRDHWKQNPEPLERLDWFGFGSIDHIGRFAKKYGWEAIPEMGIGCIFIGVESKFAGDHLKKRSKADAREVFDRLHHMGIRTVGAWMCGWDYHSHANIHEDLNYFVSLCPTYQQLTRVSPFPGTPLWEQLKKEGRVSDVPWEDVHFWSGAQKNVALEAHETLNFTEYGYDLLYQTWGPSILRRLDVQLNGYDFCRRHPSPVVRRHMALKHKRDCALSWSMLPAMDRYAPNGVVRRRVRKVMERYRRLIGEPTPIMQTMGKAVDAMATVMKVRQFFDPMNRRPKEEPFKMYHYDNQGNGGRPEPYRVEMPRPDLATRAAMTQSQVMMSALEKSLKVTGLARWKQGDPDIDEHIVARIGQGHLGFGF